MSIMIGKVLDRKYRILRLIGEGGMGSVYEAEHTLLKRRVAVKIMHPEFVSQRESVERFLQEGQAAIEISHPNIVEIHDIGREGDTVFMVMELLRGRSLDVELEEKTRLPHDKAVSIAIQVLSALQAAHDKDIIHRDLKADNVFLSVTPHGREEVKLLDFGIAKLQKAGAKKALGLTRTGNVVGTPYYLSPEQARGGKDIDSRIDIWGVGVLLYEMLSGVLPFRGENYNEILSKILLEASLPLGEIAPSVPGPLIEVIERAMSKEREDRYSEARAMITALYPFCDRERDLMSTMVIETLNVSCPPPSYTPPSIDKNSVRRSLRWADSDPNRNTVDLDTNEHMDMTGTSELPSGSRLKKITALGIGAVALTAVLMMLVFFSGENEAERMSSIESHVKIAAPVVEQPIMVKIEPKGAPDGSVYLVNGEPAEPPFMMTKSSDWFTLTVTAPEFEPFETRVVPDKNSTVAVEMTAIETVVPEDESEKTESVKAKIVKKKSKTSVSSEKKKKKKKGKAWESNPFD